MPEPQNLEPLERLEQRIVQTVSQLQAARQDKARAEQEAALLRQKVADLEGERRQILERVEGLLAHIDSLTGGGENGSA